jgi:hypothetical protein
VLQQYPILIAFYRGQLVGNWPTVIVGLSTAFAVVLEQKCDGAICF